jgi:hypothetical protein
MDQMFTLVIYGSIAVASEVNMAMCPGNVPFVHKVRKALFDRVCADNY